MFCEFFTEHKQKSRISSDKQVVVKKYLCFFLLEKSLLKVICDLYTAIDVGKIRRQSIRHFIYFLFFALFTTNYGCDHDQRMIKTKLTCFPIFHEILNNSILIMIYFRSF